MSDILLDIARSCGKQRGALRDLGLIDPADVSSLSPLVFKPGKRMYLYQQNRFSGRLVWKTDDSNRAGDVVDYTLTGFVAGIRLEMDVLAKNLLNNRCHVLATYWKGPQVLLRNMRLLHSHDSAERISGKIGYSLSGKTRTYGGNSILGATLELPTVVVNPGDNPGPAPAGGITVYTLTTHTATTSWLMPAGFILDCIYMRCANAQTTRVGTTPGGEELLPELYTDPGNPRLGGTNMLYSLVPTYLYFSGMGGTNTIDIYLKAKT